MPTRTPPKVELRKRLLRWYRASARRLPWRSTRNPYRILVSEVMLQQTQVNRVLEKYPLFLKRFPTFSSLAESTPAEVIVAWRGMGYNNRAVRLRSLAQIVRDKYRGRLPMDPQELTQLPGIGRYTANAVACFAFERHVPVVDTNIARVFARVFPHSRNDPWKTAERILPARHAYEWNQGLMELGALICTASNPRCSDCPLAGLCPGAYKQHARAFSIRKPEPRRKGVPNRIYRGRIVEELRKQNGEPAPLGRLGKRIMPGFSGQDRTWLLRLVKMLERDGLVRSVRKGEGYSVALAS
ncbi:MAG: A/G-specific adenine glycosylase [Bacteroidota bacterium]